MWACDAITIFVSLISCPQIVHCISALVVLAVSAIAPHACSKSTVTQQKNNDNKIKCTVLSQGRSLRVHSDSKLIRDHGSCSDPWVHDPWVHIGTTRLRSKRVPCCFGAEKDWFSVLTTQKNGTRAKKWKKGKVRGFPPHFLPDTIRKRLLYAS